jgi:hypothetical protein
MPKIIQEYLSEIQKGGTHLRGVRLHHTKESPDPRLREDMFYIGG